MSTVKVFFIWCYLPL